MGSPSKKEKSNIPSVQTVYVFLLICICTVIILLSSDINNLHKIQRGLQGVFGNLWIKRNKTYLILLYAKPPWMKVNNILKGKYSCEFQNCQMSVNKDDYNKSDVVLFHHNNMGIKPPKKIPSQIWIFASMESPVYTRRHYRRKEWQGIFDWTFSYRNDSEIHSAYGKLVRINDNCLEPKNYSEIFNRKTNDVAWVVSHCGPQSRRDVYVKKMSEVINVTIFGHCGRKRCLGNCFGELSKTYKFYISFENSLCLDYMTEKIFRFYDEKYDIVPVVRGAPNAKELLPIGTFIPAIDFNSPQELANYLKQVGENETLYTQYLSEKDKYNRTAGGNMYCSICSNLNNHVPRQLNLSIPKWISHRGCIGPKDL